MTRYIIFDSGCLINFTLNGLLDEFEGLKKLFKGEFLITQSVKYETIDHPLKVQRYEWGALRIKELLDNGVIKLAENGYVKAADLKNETKRITQEANNMFFAKNEAIHLIDEGEAECLALSKLLEDKNQENVLVIDERTTRVLCENPANLKEILSNKLHTEIEAYESRYENFSEFKIIRSTELAYIAYEKGLIKIKDKNLLEALFYALKFGGCSISEKEVQMIKKMA